MKEGLEIGRVGRARGLRGEVLVRLANRDSESLAPGSVVRLGADWASATTHIVTRVRSHSSGLAVAFEDVPDRTAAEKLRGLTLFVDWKDLPPLDEGEFYFEDLRGCEVVHRDGRALGTVVGLFETNTAMLVVRDGEREVYIPVLDGFVSDIDQETRRITVDPPDGLLELP